MAMAERVIRKQIRLTEQEQDDLRAYADEHGLSESDVVREGIRLQIRLWKRQRALPELLRQASEVPGDERDGRWGLR